MYCIYGVSEIHRATEGHRYLERMDEQGEVVPLLPNGNMYVTIEDERFTIANGDGEAFFIGKGEAWELTDQYRLLPSKEIVVNGMAYKDYVKITREGQEECQTSN